MAISLIALHQNGQPLGCWYELHYVGCWYTWWTSNDQIQLASTEWLACQSCCSEQFEFFAGRHHFGWPTRLPRCWQQSSQRCTVGLDDVLLTLWICRYMADEARNLKQYKELPENSKCSISACHAGFQMSTVSSCQCNCMLTLCWCLGWCCSPCEWDRHLCWRRGSQWWVLWLRRHLRYVKQDGVYVLTWLIFTFNLDSPEFCYLQRFRASTFAHSFHSSARACKLAGFLPQLPASYIPCCVEFRSLKLCLLVSGSALLVPDRFIVINYNTVMLPSTVHMTSLSICKLIAYTAVFWLLRIAYNTAKSKHQHVRSLLMLAA